MVERRGQTMYGIRPAKVTALEMSAVIRRDLAEMEFRHMLEQYGCELEQDEENDEEERESHHV